jgi:uncharacterized membrane protein
MFGLLVVGCAPPAETSCSSTAVTWDNWAHGFFVSYCTTCHAAQTPDRYGAPASIDLDTQDEVRSLAASIRRTVIDEASMPVGGGVPEDELELLDRYLACTLESP